MLVQAVCSDADSSVCRTVLRSADKSVLCLSACSERCPCNRSGSECVHEVVVSENDFVIGIVTIEVIRFVTIEILRPCRHFPKCRSSRVQPAGNDLFAVAAGVVYHESH